MCLCDLNSNTNSLKDQATSFNYTVVLKPEMVTIYSGYHNKVVCTCKTKLNCEPS